MTAFKWLLSWSSLVANLWLIYLLLDEGAGLGPALFVIGFLIFGFASLSAMASMGAITSKAPLAWALLFGMSAIPVGLLAFGYIFG